MTKKRVFESTARRQVMTSAVDRDPILKECRRHFLILYRRRGGRGIGDFAASEMIHAIGRFLNEKENGDARPLFYDPAAAPETKPEILEHGEYSALETAAYLGYSLATARRYIRQGRFPGSYLADRNDRRSYWVPGSAILAFEKEKKR